MKHTALIIALAAATVLQSYAQEGFNTHYQWMEGYARGIAEYSPHCANPRNVPVPDIPGYRTFKADLHMHTIYSDAQVTPKMRVVEAWTEGLDILAFTDHTPYPWSGISQDLNAPFAEAKKTADNLGLRIIKGIEITCSDPMGHINVLFIDDANPYRMSAPTMEETERVLDLAKANDAYIFTNHPGWPDENSTLTDYVAGHLADGTFRGIEIFNCNEFYPMAIDHALKYNVAMLSNTDSHYPTYFTYDQEDGDHREITLIFAKDDSDEGLKEALRAGRTLAWGHNILCGREDLMRTFLHACIKVVYAKYDDEGFVRFRLENVSDIPFVLKSDKPQEAIRIPARGLAEAKRKVASLSDNFEVVNTYVTSTGHLEIPLSFLLQEDGQICAPSIRDSSIKLSDEGISFTLSCNDGDTYYTLDGSEPDENSTLYDGGAISLPAPATLKAVTMDGCRKSPVYERRIAFSMASKCKARKNGVNFKFYENDNILSTKDIEKIGVLTKEGVYPELSIPDGIGRDHFGYVFTGVLKVARTGPYTFILTTNDGSDLYIGGEMAVDNDSHQGQTTGSGKIWLQKGCHPFRIRYFEGYGGESFMIQWQTPGNVVAGDLPPEAVFLE